MYESFYGLRERPFDLTPNPRFLFLSQKHREALATLQYGLTARKGVTVVTGDAGTGKTTLIRSALNDLQLKDCKVVCLDNPTLTRAEFLEFVAFGFDLGPEAATSKTRLLLELKRTALERHLGRGATAFIVDEAQVLPDGLLEEIRLLANIETDTHKLLNIILTGQPELADRLNQKNLRQLKQRVAIRCEITPLDLQETAAYIAARLWVASGQNLELFSHEAIEIIHEQARGIPRTINVICDNALIAGFASDEKVISAGTIDEVCTDLDLEPADRRVEFKRTTAASPAWPSGLELSGRESDNEPTPVTVAGEGAQAAVGQPDENGSDLFSSFTGRRRSGFLQLFQLL